MIHELKLQQPFYNDALKGDKTFEVRQNDRDFRVGDYLALNEYATDENGFNGNYTGQRVYGADNVHIRQQRVLQGRLCNLGD